MAGHENRAADLHLPILVTGSAGFMGRNLVAWLRATGYDNLMEYDAASPEGALEEYAGRAGFVFHLAGVNRPVDKEEFYTGNAGLTTRLVAALQQAQNKAPLVLTSSAQAGNGSDYAKSKEEAENAVFAYAAQSGAPAYVFRLPGVFGKWSRPDYNSVVATFCHNVARELPIEVRDPAFTLPLCYIDDVLAAFAQLLPGGDERRPEQPGERRFLGIDPTYEVSLGWLAGTIRSFARSRENLLLPDMSDDCTRKLWATYLSFIPPEGRGYPLQTHADERGSFTEFLRSRKSGQVSVNISKPGIVKGEHWHMTKNEKFLVVSGEGVIRMRHISSEVVDEYRVSGAELRVIDIPPGVTHNIENTGEDDMVTVMWASEAYDPEAPDTYTERV